MILFPDQYGNAKEESMTFTAAQHQEESSIYNTIAHWMNRYLFHRSNQQH